MTEADVRNILDVFGYSPAEFDLPRLTQEMNVLRDEKAGRS